MNLITQRGQPKEYKDLDSGREWFSISQIRKAMHDPFCRADAQQLALAKHRGTELHMRFALALAGKAGLCPYPDVIHGYEGYCRGMDQWIAETTFDPLKIEEPSVCEKYGFAGTPENYLRMPGGLAIVDLKTGGETKTDGIQLTLNTMLAGYEEATILMDLYLSEDGSVRPVPRKPDVHGMAAALATIQLLKWRLTI